MGDLARWAESQHPRDDHGRFTDSDAFDAAVKKAHDLRDRAKEQSSIADTAGTAESARQVAALHAESAAEYRRLAEFLSKQGDEYGSSYTAQSLERMARNREEEVDYYSQRAVERGEKEKALESAIKVNTDRVLNDPHIPMGPLKEEQTKGARIEPTTDFKHVYVGADSRFEDREVTGGLNHHGVHEWMRRDPANQPSLQVLREWGEGDEKGGKAYGSAGQFYRKGIGTGDPTIYVDHTATSLGEKKEWGDTFTVSSRNANLAYEAALEVDKDGAHKYASYRKGELAQVQGTFIHELGHHIALSDAAKRVQVDDVVRTAYNKRFEKPGLAEKVQKEEVKSPAISRYAAKNRDEYFAESFIAYMTHPSELKQHDKIGYKMVSEVMRRMGIERGRVKR